MEPLRLSRQMIRNSAKALVSLFGGEWLESKVAVHQDDEMHPLAKWILEAKRELGMAEPNPKVSQTMLHIAWLVRNVRVLRGANVGGLDERLSRLTSGTEEQFWATLHEFRTAHMYLHTGQHVAFVPEARERTPDLLINGSIEIECKSKARTTKRDRHRRALYRLMYRRVRKFVYADQSLKGLEMAAIFSNEPTRGSIDEAIGRAKSFFDDHVKLMEFSSDSNRRLRLIRLFPTVFEDWQRITTVINNTMADTPPEYDDADFQVPGTKFDDGTVQAKKVTGFVCKCDVEEDAVKSLRLSLTGAADQLSGKRIGIIHLDVTSVASRLLSRHLDKTRAVVAEVCRQRTSISAVQIVHDHVGRDQNNWIIGTAVDTFRNPNARHPLAQEEDLLR